MNHSSSNCLKYVWWTNIRPVKNGINEGTTLMKDRPPWWTYWTCTFIRNQINVSICRFIVSNHHCRAQRTVLYYITSPLPWAYGRSVLHHITTAKGRWQFCITSHHHGQEQFCITSHHHCQGQMTVLYYITSSLPRADDSFLLPEVSPEDRKRPRIGWLASEHKGHWNVG